MNEESAQFMRDHFERQRNLFTRSLAVTAGLAQSNADLIAQSGINAIQSAVTRKVLREQRPEISDHVADQPLD